MKTQSIAADTRMGPVHLSVTDGERALRFWRYVVGLSLISDEEGLIRLGAGSRELVVLHPGALRPVSPRTSGLYHLAILLPNRKELARAIARLYSVRHTHYPTDHLMTKTTYLSDPDGNGVELYADTPEDGTFGSENGVFVARDAAGNERSGRDPLDVEALLKELVPDDRLDEPMPDGIKIGHVHLHVANLDEAVHFYCDIIGFDMQASALKMGAAFVSAGGYHHHLGLNTWAGEDSPTAPEGSAGLRHFTIELPTERDLMDVIGRLDALESPGGFFVSDPSSNRVFLTTG